MNFSTIVINFNLPTLLRKFTLQDIKFKSQLRNYILELSKQHATEIAKNSIHSVLNDPKNSVGLIINERYLNLPPTISVPSFTKLKCVIIIYFLCVIFTNVMKLL